MGQFHLGTIGLLATVEPMLLLGPTTTTNLTTTMATITTTIIITGIIKSTLSSMGVEAAQAENRDDIQCKDSFR
ncbi:Hypothetical predicted protein [Pelobates cultripes]|nr:Hypothetical predicted protein [Pelobates cultripes]